MESLEIGWNDLSEDGKRKAAEFFGHATPATCPTFVSTHRKLKLTPDKLKLGDLLNGLAIDQIVCTTYSRGVYNVRTCWKDYGIHKDREVEIIRKA